MKTFLPGRRQDPTRRRASPAPLSSGSSPLCGLTSFFPLTRGNRFKGFSEGPPAAATVDYISIAPFLSRLSYLASFCESLCNSCHFGRSGRRSDALLTFCRGGVARGRQGRDGSPPGSLVEHGNRTDQTLPHNQHFEHRHQTHNSIQPAASFNGSDTLFAFLFGLHWSLFSSSVA